jgi:peroxiredoxin
MSTRTAVGGVAGVLALFACGACAACGAPSRAPAASSGGEPPAVAAAGAFVGKPAPPFTRRALGGESVTVPARRDVTVVLFFATWSAPDMALVARMQRVAALHPDIAVVGVSIDDDGADVLEIARSRGARYPIVWDAGHAVASAYRPEMDPTTLILDKEGVVRFVHGGFHEGEDFTIDDEVALLLKQDLCTRPLLTTDGPACFHHCARLDEQGARCAANPPCRVTCARENASRNAALATCRRPPARARTRAECEAACHTEEWGRALDTCAYQSADQKDLQEECTAACGIAPCRASCQLLK